MLVISISRSPRLCPSTAEFSPSSVFHCLLSVAFLFQVIPSFLVKSSCHLLLGRLLDLFPFIGCHSMQRLVHLLSFILAICPTHLYFCFSVYSIMSIVFVLFLISEHGIVCWSFRPNIFLPVALWVVLSLFVNCLLRPCLAARGHCWQDTLVHYLFFEWNGELSVLELSVLVIQVFKPVLNRLGPFTSETMCYIEILV